MKRRTFFRHIAALHMLYPVAFAEKFAWARGLGCERTDRPRQLPAILNPFYTPGSISGDTFPFYYKGEWHVFHMQMPNIAHHATRDLLSYQERPLVVTRGKAGEPDSDNLATGTVLEHEGTFYCFYTGNHNVCLATSQDLNHWQKHPGNPLLTGDEKIYERENFRDPFVFYNDTEQQWWMLIATRLVREPGQRASCVGLATSTDLITWTLQKALWATTGSPHTECPQLIRHGELWYLLYLQRNTRSRFAPTYKGPFQRAVNLDLGTVLATAGSRPAFDGQRWVSWPFVTRQTGRSEQGEWQYGGHWCVPRELSFHGDGQVTERPVRELIAAAHALPTLAANDLHRSTQVVGQWHVTEHHAQCLTAEGGTLLLENTPSDLYLEVDLTLEDRLTDIHFLLRIDASLKTGYQLSFSAAAGLLTLRSLSYWDVEPVMAVRPVKVIPNQPLKVQMFMGGTILEVFISNESSLTARLYKYRQGTFGIEFRDGPGMIENLILRQLSAGSIN